MMMVPANHDPDRIVTLTLRYATYAAAVAAFRVMESSEPSPVRYWREARHELQRAMLEDISREITRLRNAEMQACTSTTSPQG